MSLSFNVLQDIVTSNSMRVGKWIYRGHTKYAWKLETSYSRFLRSVWGDSFAFTLDPFRSMLARFLRRAAEYSGGGYSEYSVFQQMALAQHHGIPTPMLDWSYSPYVAAYFALADSSLVVARGVTVAIHALNVTSVYGPEQGKSEELGRVDLPAMDFRFVDTPLFSSRRITRQLGCFTFQNFAGDLREWCMSRRSTPLEENDFKVFEIEGDRLQLLRQLELMGISGGSLFDDLDYVARDVVNAELANSVSSQSVGRR